MKVWKLLFCLILSVVIFTFQLQPVWAFCGFYVAKADSKLFNKASQVVIARDGNKTVLTMVNDYQGDVKDFALVVPIPVAIKPEQVTIGNLETIQKLDAFSAPRLAQYYHEPPCNINNYIDFAETPKQKASKFGVTVEEQFKIGEYEILVLSATESKGLETWLITNGYQLPQGANQVLRPYIRQDMKFFVAKVNLEEFDKQQSKNLRPLKIAYESPKFMLPIRLGMLNANGEQDLIIYLISSQGQVELTNYRTVSIPTNIEIPEFIETEFNQFYQAMFQHSYEQHQKKVAFLEYAWNMSWCDPCSAEPLTKEQLTDAGIFWLNDQTNKSVFLTRLHIRYSRDNFPEDLFFQETHNTKFFQGLYTIHRPFTDWKSWEQDWKDQRAYLHNLQQDSNPGYAESARQQLEYLERAWQELDCENAQKQYNLDLIAREVQQARNLSNLTGWNMDDIYEKMNYNE